MTLSIVRAELSKDDVIQAASFPLVTGQIKIDDNALAKFFIRSSTKILTDGGCAAAWDLRLVEFANTKLHTGKTKFVTIVLWSNVGLVIGPPGTFGKQVQDIIERQAKKFVVTWAIDNQ